MKHLLATALALTINAHALADGAGMTKVGDIAIHDGWARASIGKAPNSAAYMKLMIDGDAGDTLIGASTTVADKAELHTHILENDIAKMRPVDAIDVIPGEPTVLEPGGLHLMLMGLTQPLEEGDALPLTLIFEKAGDVSFDLPILGIRAVQGQHDGGEMKHEHEDGEMR